MPEEKKMTAEEAKVLLEKEKAERESRCSKRLQDVLSEENCVMEIETIISATRGIRNEVVIRSK